MKLFKMPLALQMAIATLLGVFCGLFFGDLCSIFSPWANAYIMILKITAVPYLIGAIMHGVGLLTINQGKEILKKGILFIAITWAVNLSIIYLIYFAFPQPTSTHLTGNISSGAAPLNFADLLIPENIFFNLSNNIVPAVVVFSLLIGLGLMHLKEKETFMTWLENWVQALTRITGWIARITPYGTFLVIANQFGTIEFATVKQVSTYVILYIMGISVIVFWIFPKLTQMLTGMPSYRWLQQLFPILLLAYTTNVVIVCLPYIIELLYKETQKLDPKDTLAQKQIQGTVSVVFNLPLAALFITVFVLFSSLLYGSPLSFGAQLQLFMTTFLTSLGAVGLGSWINSLTFLLDSLALPLDAINLFLTTVPFTSGFQSMLAVMEISTLALLITLACRKMLILKWHRLVKGAIIITVPVFVLFIAVKWFVPLPKIQSVVKSIYELSIESTSPAELSSSKRSSSSDPFEQILESQTLRVGYHPNVPPFCLKNFDGEIVGYDIAFAYELAFDLGCQLQLVPMNYSHLAEELHNNRYDIAMSAVSITEPRLKELAFTSSYMTPRLALVVHEEAKAQFMHENEFYYSPRLTLAVLKGSSFEALARELFPHKTLILLDSYDDFVRCNKTVAILWEEEEAAAWTICHRKFRVIFPPLFQGRDSLGYAIAPNNPRFLAYLNQWLELKKTQGFTQTQRELWIEGKTHIAAPYEPRWSVIRNVLHWID